MVVMSCTHDYVYIEIEIIACTRGFRSLMACLHLGASTFLGSIGNYLFIHVCVLALALVHFWLGLHICFLFHIYDDKKFHFLNKLPH